VVRELAEDYRASADAKGPDAAAAVGRALPQVVGDADRVRQA
jgi:hypothetical protein